jgi:hypothetical protein
VYFEYSMDDGYVPPVQLEDHDLAHPNGRLGHVEEEEVAAVERRLHASAARGGDGEVNK